MPLHSIGSYGPPCRALRLLLQTCLILGARARGDAWQLSEYLGLPEWLRVSGEHRVRYETLDGQFRAGRTGGDQALAFRTTLLAEIGSDPVTLVAEGLDARHALTDPGSPIDTTHVDTVDLLQAHLRLDAGNLLPGGRNTVRIGRETLDLGSRRLVARNAYRNTINAFTGVDWLWEESHGAGSVRAVYLLPVRRLPSDPESLRDGDIQADSEAFDQQFWGVQGSWNLGPRGLALEGYYLRLHESGDPAFQGRRLHTPGIRLVQPPARGHWDLELETTLQWGSVRGTGPAPGQRIDHRAHHHHASVGYTFDAPGQPRLDLRYDEASGDRDPGDATSGRFDTLFGARRFEFGPTGIYGAVARSNLRSPAWSASVRPAPSLQAEVVHRLLWLAEARDAWVPAGLRDSSGSAGTALGQQLEARARWTPKPGNLQFSAGIAHLFAGQFLDVVPGGNGGRDVHYAHLEATLRF